MSRKMKQRLLDYRESLIRQRDALDNQIKGVERAIALMDNEFIPDKPEKSSIKTIVLDLLEEVGTTGLNAVTALEMADSRGQRLERGSVSSLLSRLKGDGIVDYDSDGKVYRLRQYAKQVTNADTNVSAFASGLRPVN